MLKLLKCEYMKLKRSKFLIIGILGTLIVPFFVIIKSLADYISRPGTPVSLFSLYDGALMFLMLLFGPLALTISGAWLIGREYTDGTLKNIFAIPVSPRAFLTGKMLFFATLSVIFMIISWLEILAAAILCGYFIPVTELTAPSAAYFLIKMIFGGILLCASQTPFLYLTIRAKGFMLPLTASAAISLLNVVLSNSPIACYYPWSAAYLLVSGRAGAGCPKAVSIAVIGIVCLCGIMASFGQFQKENI